MAGQKEGLGGGGNWAGGIGGVGEGKGGEEGGGEETRVFWIIYHGEKNCAAVVSRAKSCRVCY